MRFPCCFCCLKWGKISPSAVTCCERKLRFFWWNVVFFCHSFLFYIFFGCCCFTVFPNCYWSSWWSRKRQCRCIWRKTMVNGCVANSPASTVKPNLVFLADRVCRVNSSQKFRKSSLSWILFCQHGLFSNCLQRILYVNLIVNLLLRITSMMSLHIHGHVIRTELQPKVLALQSCLWKQEVTPKSLEKFRLNVKIWKPKLVTYWKHVLSTAGSRLQFCLVQCVGIRILPNFVLSPSQCRKTLEN